MTVVVDSPPPVPERTQPPGAPVTRGVVDGLRNPKPISELLPALLQEDDFCVRLTQAFDAVIAPVLASLDCFDSYLATDLTPEDFLDWLATWVGVEVDDHWPIERRRRLVREIAALYRMRGTAAGLSAHVELYTGFAPEILENGGCQWSQTADSPLPGSGDAQLTVRLSVADPGAVNRNAVDRIVAASRPAHLRYTIEVATSQGKVVKAPKAPEAAGGAADDAPGAVDLPGSERIDMAPPGPDAEQVEEVPEPVEEDPEPAGQEEEEPGE